jgi:hypothetical protein
MKKAVGFAFVLVLVALLVLFWRTTRAPAPASDTATGQAGSTAVPAGTGTEPGSCDQQPRPPKLPDRLSPASADMAGVVRALDAALNDQHKAWLRCFTLDDELLARTQNGMGRWLRTTLHLTRRPALLTALGAKTPDEASSIITLVYASHLRGQELSPAEAGARRIAALADAGVTP